MADHNIWDFLPISLLVIIMLVIMILVYSASGQFDMGDTEQLANDVCELRFNTTAESYEGGVLTCTDPDKVVIMATINPEPYTIDYGDE